MYECGAVCRFRAKHALIGDFGEEAKPHSHNYRLYVSLKGPSLDENGFLFDLAKLQEKLDEVIKTLLSYPSLNQIPDIKGENPSAENLARYILESLARELNLSYLEGIAVTVWESEFAWASCAFSTDELRGGSKNENRAHGL